MKFAHSLVFNSVPDWNAYYLNYESLKSAIYRFEKNALVIPPPTSYSDNPTDLESAPTEPISPSIEERTFVRLLDKELMKITTFYTEKESELKNDLDLLLADIERIEEQDDEFDTGNQSNTSDEEYHDDDESFKATATKALQSAFSNPSKYDEAMRAGRKANATGRAHSKQRSSGDAASGSDSKNRRRAHSNVSDSANLLSLSEDDHLDVPSTRSIPNSPSKFGSAAKRRSSMRRSSRMGMSTTSGHYEDEVEGLGIWGSNSDWAIDTKIMYKRRITALFTGLSELKQFVDLNYTGLRKILKKYDKITNSALRQTYMTEIVDKTYPFLMSTQTALTASIQSLVPVYAKIVTLGDEDFALKQMKAHLREHVVWERNTVWREMIGLERKGWSGTSKRDNIGAPMIEGSEGEIKSSFTTPVGKIFLPNWFGQQVIAGLFGLIVFGGLLWGVDWFDRVEEQNCLALLGFVTIFWALEVVPLFVTALMVPFLVVVLRVLRSVDGEDRRLSASEATKYIFGQMFSPTIMLLLGGFTLAAALSKQNIDKVLATKVLSFAGTKPRNVLLAYMCVACFASMWISNVAAPVLCYSLIQPILRTLPSKSPFSKSLILGIALASNIGGMASPISSPQNLIALEYMNPPISWLGWFSISIPVASTSIFFIWLILLYSYRSGKGVVINPVRVNKESWTGTQWFVCAVTIFTILLWCVESRLAWILGDMGIIAIIPIVLFYGTGILRKADFDHSPWSIVFLAMGGIGLGKAVLSSGLLDDMDRVIQKVVLGLDIWPILAIFSCIVLVIATLISHTIASVLVVPIAAQIGAAMEVPHPRLLILATALICSAGMGLPISGFPNLQAINVEDDMGQRYLEPSDFFKNGIPASIVAVIVIITVGYSIMRFMGM